jgi:hypothetical protein
MTQVPLTRLSHAFCSHCGYPVSRGGRDRAERICPRCKLGMLVFAPAGDEPQYGDSFVIVDERLALRAVSRHAEVMLLVPEPAGVGVPLGAFLSSGDGDRHLRALTELVELAVAGTSPNHRVALRRVGSPELRLRGRVTSCGPPPSALLVLSTYPVPALVASGGREADHWSQPSSYP